MRRNHFTHVSTSPQWYLCTAIHHVPSFCMPRPTWSPPSLFSSELVLLINYESPLKRSRTPPGGAECSPAALGFPPRLPKPQPIMEYPRSVRADRVRNRQRGSLQACEYSSRVPRASSMTARGHCHDITAQTSRGLNENYSRLLGRDRSNTSNQRTDTHCGGSRPQWNLLKKLHLLIKWLFGGPKNGSQRGSMRPGAGAMPCEVNWGYRQCPQDPVSSRDSSRKLTILRGFPPLNVPRKCQITFEW